MRSLLKEFYIFFSLLAYSMLFCLQMPQPGQFGPQDIDAILNNMSEKELNNILEELSKLSPQELEELEKIGRQVLSDLGIDPDTGKPIETINSGLDNNQKVTQPETIKDQPDSQPVTLIKSPEKVKFILDTIIKHINEIRQKSSTNNVINRRINQWQESLQDLLFYIKIINKKEHHDRLATKDFEKLFQNLEELAQYFDTYQPRIFAPEKPPHEDDPYVILQVNYTASPEEITQKYISLKKQYNPKTIKKRLENQHASKKDIDREMRAAKLTFSYIQDAYDQLLDNNTRKIIDEKRSLENSNNNLSPSSQNALTQTIDALNNAIYQQKLLDELQDFLKKYEPEQLSQKESLDKARAQRNKEQMDQTKVKPALNTTKYDKNYPQQSPYAQNKGFGGANYGSPSLYDMQNSRIAEPKEPLKTLGQEGGTQENKSPAKQQSGPDQKSDKKNEPDDKMKKLMDDASKKNAAEKKKDDDKKIKDLENELKKYENKEPQETSSTYKNKKTAFDKEIPQDKKVPTSELTLEMLKKDLIHTKKSMASKKVSRILRRTAKATSPLITEGEIAILETLGLNTLYNHLVEFKDSLTNNSKKLYEPWNTLTIKYTPTLLSLNKNIDQEIAKQERENKDIDPSSKIRILQEQIKNVLNEYNIISEIILGKRVIDDTIPEQNTESQTESTLIGDLF